MKTGARRTLRVLHIEDSESDAALILRELHSAGYDVYSERIEDAKAMQMALASRPWDVILADHRLPRFDAPEALVVLQQSGRDIPFIVVSGAIGEDVAVAMMKAGAHDYLLKSNLARLAPAIEREMREARERRERELAGRAMRAREWELKRRTMLLEQREVLLREVHHRVKNNMQVVSSMLRMEVRSAADPETRRILQDNQRRVQAVALLHDLLYRSADLATVDLGEYVGRIAGYLSVFFGLRGRPVRIVTELDTVPVRFEQALPAGLLMSELLSNSLKHVFPDGPGGEVRISVRELPGGAVLLEVAGNGIGLPPDTDVGTSRSVGPRLIRALSRQLDASLEVRTDGSTRFGVRFHRGGSGMGEGTADTIEDPADEGR